MQLSLLPSATSLTLSSAREFIKIEITCSERPVQISSSRPPFPSHESFSSSSESTSSASSARKRRPKLSPEALLVHAFGPSALSRLSPLPSSAGSSTPSDDSRSSVAWKSASTCPSTPPIAVKSSNSSERRYREKCESIPKAPPLGTFRSAPKPVKAPSPEFRFAELVPGVDTPADAIQKSRKKKVEREQPISRDSWSEKVEERLQRRKLLRLKTWREGDVRLPLNIDSRPLQGSLGLPPLVDPPQRLPKQSGLKKRNLSSPALIVAVHDGAPNDKDSVQDKEERRKSMVELQDLGGLIKQTEAILLDEPTG